MKTLGAFTSLHRDSRQPVLQGPAKERHTCLLPPGLLTSGSEMATVEKNTLSGKFSLQCQLHGKNPSNSAPNFSPTPGPPRTLW